MRMFVALLQAQTKGLIFGWRAQPFAASSGVAFLMGLYLAVVLWVIPKLSSSLIHTYETLLQARGQTDATFYVALIQLFTSLVLIGPVLLQGSHLLDSSYLLRIFYQRVRDARQLVLFLQWEICLVFIAAQILIAPLNWSPFLDMLPLRDGIILILVQLCILFMLLCVLHPFLALIRITAHFDHGLSLRWLLAILYYVSLSWIGWLCQRSFSAPSSDQVLVILLRWFRSLLIPGHEWVPIMISALFLSFSFVGAHKLSSRAIQVYGT